MELLITSIFIVGVAVILTLYLLLKAKALFKECRDIELEIYCTPATDIYKQMEIADRIRKVLHKAFDRHTAHRAHEVLTEFKTKFHEKSNIY